jgi:membrane-associated phospholipid phosphatase
MPALPGAHKLDQLVSTDYDLTMTNPSQSAGGEIENGADSNRSGQTVSAPRASTRVRWGETIILITLVFYAVLAVLAHRYAYFDWDLTLARGIQSISLPGFEKAMSALSLLGEDWIAWPLVAAAGLAMIRAGFRTEGVISMAGAGLGSAANLLLKVLVGRPRPADMLVTVARAYSRESFPSGHVFFFVEFFGFLFFLAYVLLKPGWVRRGSLVVLGGLVALAGVSRVYLGAHWPSDVVGAYLAGGIWLVLMIEVYRRIKSRRQN